MKLILFVAILLFPALAMAQDEGVDSSPGCAEVLAAPPFVDMLTRNEGRGFREFSSPSSMHLLLGLECSLSELTEFFENAGWELQQFEESSLLGPFKRNDGTPDYYIDAAADFCLKRPMLFGLFDYRCRPIASVYFHEGRISSLNTSMNK